MTGQLILPRRYRADLVFPPGAASATVVAISLAPPDGLITLDITDNGRGLGTPTRSSGLASMPRRAERNRGTLQITSPSGGGTRLTWTARSAA